MFLALTWTATSLVGASSLEMNTKNIIKLKNDILRKETHVESISAKNMDIGHFI